MNLCINSLPDNKILDSSKLKDFADDNIKFEENSRKLFKPVENTVGKRRNCLLRAISPFATVFSKGLFPKGIKGVLVWELVNPFTCSISMFDAREKEALWKKEKMLVT